MFKVALGHTSGMVNLINIPTEKFTTNILCVLLRRPLCRNELTLNALIPPILARGCVPYPSLRAIRLAAENMQGAIFDAQVIKKGEWQLLQFFLETADSGQQAYEFLHKIITQPLFDADSFVSEAENLRHRINSRINNKSEYATLLCIEAMCQNEPFGLYGDGYAEDLPKLTVEDLRTHYEEIRGTSPIDVITLGRWDEGLLRNIDLTDHKSKAPALPQLQSARETRQIIEQDHGSAQGNLCIGLRSSKPFSIATQLANEILGGGPNAKLFTNIREKESLCYAVYSTIYRFKSLMQIVAGTEPAQLSRVAELSEAELVALQRGNFTAEDLSSAKQSLAKRWRVMQDKPSACVDFFASQHLLNDTSSLDDMISQVENVSASQVAEAASQLKIDTVVKLK